jgi:hypothetical protein
MVQIRDIKPPIEIPDYSLLYLVVVSLLCISVAIILLIWLVKFIKNRNKKSQKEIYIEMLKSVDLENTKDSAYTITKYARKLAVDNRSIEIFEALSKSLAKYKYKKDVTEFDDETIRYYHLFLDIAKDVELQPSK